MALQTDQPRWIDRLNQAVCRGTVTEITDEIKQLLEEMATEERVLLPDRFQRSRDDGYAQLEGVQYERVESDEGRFRFRESGQTRAAVGDAGALIPPYEYHVLRNALADRISITLHVYGGEMDHCNCFSPRDDGWWQKSSHRLVYDT